MPSGKSNGILAECEVGHGQGLLSLYVDRLMTTAVHGVQKTACEVIGAFDSGVDGLFG